MLALRAVLTEGRAPAWYGSTFRISDAEYVTSGATAAHPYPGLCVDELSRSAVIYTEGGRDRTGAAAETVRRIIRASSSGSLDVSSLTGTLGVADAAALLRDLFEEPSLLPLRWGEIAERLRRQSVPEDILEMGTLLTGLLAVFGEESPAALRILTMSGNAAFLGQAHDVSHLMIWLLSLDPSYAERPAGAVNDGSFYRLTVSGATSLTVTDGAGAVAARIGRAGTSSASVLSCARDEDGTMTVYLPPDGAFRYACGGEGVTVTLARYLPETGTWETVRKNCPAEGSI